MRMYVYVCVYVYVYVCVCVCARARVRVRVRVYCIQLESGKFNDTGFICLVVNFLLGYQAP